MLVTATDQCTGCNCTPVLLMVETKSKTLNVHITHGTTLHQTYRTRSMINVKLMTTVAKDQRV